MKTYVEKTDKKTKKSKKDKKDNETDPKQVKIKKELGLTENAKVILE